MSFDGIDHAVRTLLAKLGVGSEPPVDLPRVAMALGVTSIEIARMAEEGRLEQKSGQVRIWLRDGAPIQRQRFTLAHELGHLLLADPNRDFVAHRAWRGPDQEERFCDAFAASLLLPRDWLVGTFSGRPECLDTVREVADRTGASLSASVVRLRELLSWQRSLLCWRYTEGQWSLLYSAGVPREIHHRVTSAPNTRVLVDQFARERHAGVRALPLLVSGIERVVSAEVSVRGSAVLALADLRTAAGGPIA